MNPTGSSVADGVEFEETFPESQAEHTSLPAPAPVRIATPLPSPVEAPAAPAAPRLSVVRPEPSAETLESHFQEQLERRMREAEALLKKTIETMRADEEKRLAEWVRTRREDEEHRLARWADERRAPRVERRAVRDDVVQRIEEMLHEWQARFEAGLDQRRNDDARIAERQRISDEERLRAWRTELERALTRSVAGDRAIAPERADRSPLADAIAGATCARDIGRILQGALAEMARTSAFALAIHQDGRDDVAYRYRVATDDEVGSLLRREALDDAAESAAAHADGWVRAQRVVRAGTRNATVHTAQLAIRVGDMMIGVLTLQTEATPIADAVLPRFAELARLAAPRLAELRDTGSFRGV